MSVAAPAIRGGRVARAVRSPDALLIAVLAVVGAWICWRALNEAYALDTALAHQGGQEAWLTGHPERLGTWISTPFLGMVMALVSRVADATATGYGMTILNAGLAAGAIAVVWRRLRSQLSPLAWRASLAAIVCFAPLASTIWWKQFNLIALVLALAGFAVARGGRWKESGLLIGLSISVKPIIILLPVWLLLKRDTRRAGVASIAAVAALNLVGQAFMAWRAGNLATLWPGPALTNFNEKSLPANQWVCYPDNFSPAALMCRLAGTYDWSMVRLVVFAAALMMLLLALDSLRGLPGLAWGSFAFACMLSPLFSPLAWSHYQLLLAPMLVLLFVEFARRGASPGLWLWLAGGYALAMLILQPYGTVPGQVRSWFKGGEPENYRMLVEVFSVAQFAQYAVFLTAVLWFSTRRGTSWTQAPN